MPDAYVIEVSGRTAGIVARDSQNNSFNFYSAVPRFNSIEGQRNLDSSVPMMEPAKDRMRNNVSEPLDRACAGRVLPERNIRTSL
jgi:hypothetical protein